MEVDVVKKKIYIYIYIYIYISMYIEDGTVEQLQPEARCIVQHSGFKETSKG